MTKRILMMVLAFLLMTPTWAEKLVLKSRYSYYTSEVRGEFMVVVPQDESISKVRFSLGEKTLYTQDDVVESGQHLWSFDLQGISQGTHQVLCSFVQDGKEKNLSFPLVKLAPQPNEVKIDHLTGGLLDNGLPFYPFGFYCRVPFGDLALQEIYNGFTHIGPYQKIDEETLETRKAYMDQCAALGMKVHYSLISLIGSGHNKGSHEVDPQEEKRREALLRKEVEMFKDHPALLCWYLNDEPLGQGRPVPLLENAYNLVKELDPYHPISIVFMMPHRAHEFKNAMDIAMTDPYPVPGPIDKVYEDVKSLQDQFRYEKSVWLVPQAFGGGEFWMREPNAAEMRALTYLGLVEKAMGIQYFLHRGPNLFPKSRPAWFEASAVAHEVLAITPWLFSSEEAPKATCSDETIKIGTWKSQGQTLVMAVNMTNTPKKLKIKVELGEDVKKGEALFENREISLEKGTINEWIDGYGTRVYVLGSYSGESKVKPHPLNLTYNPSFEEFSSPGVVMGCYAGNDMDPDYKGATSFVDSRDAVDGRRSLRMNIPVDGADVSLAFFRVLLKEGSSYSASVWAKKRKGDGPAEFTLSLPTLEVSQKFTLSEEWKLYGFHFSVNKSVPNSPVSLKMNTKGMAWFDLLEVVPDPSMNVIIEEGPKAVVSLDTRSEKGEIRYTVDGKEPTLKSRKYRKPVALKKTATVKAVLFEKGKKVAMVEQHIPLHKAIQKKISYEVPYSPKYAGKGNNTLIDGELASKSYLDGKWLGFEGKDVVMTIDLGKAEAISQVTGNFLADVNNGIHPPKGMKVEVSSDGKDFKAFGKVENKEGSLQKAAFLLPLTVEGKSQKVQFIRIRVKSTGRVPNGFLFRGTKAWLFVDEIMVID